MGTISRLSLKPGAGREGSLVLAGDIRCVVAETESEFSAMRGDWESLYESNRQSSPSMAWAWLWSWWQILGREEGVSPYVVSVSKGDELIGLFPFIQPSSPKGFLKVRRLRQMGYHGELDEPTLTEEPMAIVRGGYEEDARQALYRHIEGGLRRGRWDCATVRFEAHGTAQLVVRGGPIRRGVIALDRTKEGAQMAPIAETWDSFRRSLSKSMRDNLSYYPRLLLRDGRCFEVHLHTDDEPVACALDHLIELHRRRALEDPSGQHDNHIPGEAQAEMLQLALTRMAAEGKALVATLNVDGEVVAAQAFLRSNRQLLMHYSGFAQSHARYSPLLVLQAAVLRDAIERGISEMNLLYGQAQWQKRWNAESGQRLVQCRMAGLRPASLLRCAIYALQRDVAARVRRRKLALPVAMVKQTLSTFTGGMLELHLNLAKFASMPVAHHLARLHR